MSATFAVYAAMRRLSALVRPSSGARALALGLLVWNPLVASAFALTFGGARDFVSNAGFALLIADLVVVQCFAGVAVVRGIERVWAGRAGRSVGPKRLGAQFVLAAAWIPLALPVAFAVGRFVAQAFGQEWAPLDSRSYRLGVGIGLLLTIVFFFQRRGSEARDAASAAEARVSELENKRLRAQLAALTAEMNPHLLFNALNTVAALVHHDPNRAEEVVIQLSELYRAILRSASSATHPLEDELRLCDAYLRIEHARFGERLVGEIDLDPAVDVRAIQVPVLVLQPFVENAVKHGLSERAAGGKVRLSARMNGRRLDITVDDDGIGFGKSTRVGAGKAITNCRQRLALTYGESASLEVAARRDGGTRVLVSLPIGGVG